MDEAQEALCLSAAKLLGQPWLIQDVTTCIRQPVPRIDLDIVTHIILHRIEVGRDAAEIAQWFRDNPEWVGPEMPYKFIVSPSGLVQQALLMNRKGNHAAGLNHRSIGVGIIGDFRALDDLGDEEVHPGLTGVAPTPEAVAATIACCVRIRDSLRNDVALVGHSAVAQDPLKRCPGALFPVSFVARAVEAFGKIQWKQKGL